MPKKYKNILKSIGRKWFLILVIVIILVFLVNRELAIWMTIITVILYAFSYLPVLFFSRRFQKYIKNFNALEDKLVARKFKRSLAEIQESMFNLSQKQNNKTWLIIFLNKQYIFYNQETIDKFKEYYNKGLGEKELLEAMKEFNVKTRAEVKGIEEALINCERLTKREISVKEYREKIRYS